MPSWLHRQNVVRSFSSFSRFLSVVHRFLIPIPFIYTPTGCYFYFKKINALIFDSVLYFWNNIKNLTKHELLPEILPNSKCPLSNRIKIEGNYVCWIVPSENEFMVYPRIQKSKYSKVQNCFIKTKLLFCIILVSIQFFWANPFINSNQRAFNNIVSKSAKVVPKNYGHHIMHA